MSRTAQMSKEKRQSIITLIHGQNKSIKHYDETGSHEDFHRKERPRVTSAAEDKFIIELTASQIAAQINASESLSNRHNSTSRVQRRLHQSVLHDRIAVKKPLLKDTNKKKRLAWSKKHKPWTLDRWKLVWWVPICDFWFQPACLCETQSRWTDDLCMCGSHREAQRRMVWGFFAGDTVCDLFRIQGTLNQYDCHSILQRYAIPSTLARFLH